ncbi:MAG: hypothetical protein P4L56_16245 [Candidatus Sulfopaludibacter sp.]|nr:hypothetical protein [Candidatus Sulfopaludibacter sp.]
MPGATGVVALACLGLALTGPVFAIDADRNFGGRWILDPDSSDTRAIGPQPEREFTVTQQDAVILVSMPSDGPKAVEWFYSLTGAEARYKIGAESRNSMAKWEGAALLINTLVSGPQNYTVMDRWRLSQDHVTLTIVRQIVRRNGTVEGKLVFHKVAGAAPPAAEAPTRVDAPPEPPLVAPRREPVRAEPARLAVPPPSPEPAELVVPAGTRIPLALRNTVDTRHSHEGDHIYLRTAMPIAVSDRIVIPQGSFVNGTLTLSKPAGKVKGKAELFIRFDTIVLPNGVTRDFHSRLASADSRAQGTVDSEGKVTGERDSRGDTRAVATTTGAGTAVGGIAGGAAGHPITGLGVGAAAGAGAGLASVLLTKRPEVVLPQGTTLDMILDRDLHYTTEELGRPRRY